MHAAPPVSVQGTGGWCWRAVQALLPALAAAAFGHWVLAHAEWPAAFALVPAAAVGGLAWRRLRRPESVVLSWDGQHWAFDGQPGSVQIMIDLDRWLLLRCRPAAAACGGRWLAIAASEAGAHWPLLRAALHGRAARPAADGQAVPSADV